MRSIGSETAFRAAFIFVLAFAFLTRFARLDAPPIPIFDEGLFYLPAAQAYLAGLPDPNFEHPPLGKLLIALGIGLFGDNPWGWRLASAVAGTAGIALTYRFGALLFGRREVGLFAAAFLSLDFLWLSFSRFAMLDIFQATLILAALTAGWSYRTSGNLRWLAASAASLGFATAVKWSGAWVLLPMLLVVFLPPEKATPEEIQPSNNNGSPRPLILSSVEGMSGRGDPPYNRWLPPIVFVFAGASAYGASWLYHVLMLGFSFGDLVALHIRMLTYQVQVGTNRGPVEDNFLAPLSWLFGAPLVFTAREDRSVWVLVTSNPLLLWSGFFAMLWMLRRGIGFLRSPELFLSLSFFALYLPWFMLPRLKYFYYLLPALPLLAIAVAAAYVRLWRWSRILNDRRMMQARVAIMAFLAVTAAVFVAIYPAIAGYWRG